MVSNYTSPPDKLARQILKAATKGAAGQRLTLPIIEGWLYGELPEAIGGAIHHAVEAGWLRYQEGAWMVTPTGEKIGRRSRAGVKTKRKRL
jgi:hypothetical protein